MPPLSDYGRNIVFGTWIEWPGGPCPVTEYTAPEVRYRSGGTTEMQANRIRWSHTGEWNDVMAYRIRQPVMPGFCP
jgi:hypothetical protein